MADLAAVAWLVLAALEWVFWGASMVTVWFDRREEGLGADARDALKHVCEEYTDGPVMVKIIGVMTGVGAALAVWAGASLAAGGWAAVVIAAVLQLSTTLLR